MSDATPDLSTPVTTDALETAPAPSRLRAWWSAFVAAIGTVVGLAPHVLHHIGLFAGTALVVGTGGNLLFGAIGLAASLPLLLRLKRRFNSWWAPAIALTIFAAMFSLSAFVIGPAISGGGAPEPPADGQPAPTTDHSGHHN